MKAFTLAEVLITLAIIGVVAAISIPSVISNSQQQEFKTGLKKAVSVLNSAITMNIALDGESPYDNGDLFRYLQRHMSVMASFTRTPYYYTTVYSNGQKGSYGWNGAFYTTDGMRFEFEDICSSGSCMGGKQTHEGYMQFCIPTSMPNAVTCKGCGSFGLKSNPNNTTLSPCLIMVDINGDRKPNPSNVNCNDPTCGATNYLKILAPDSKTINDIHTIMITDEKAIPYGVLSQRAMYGARN